MVAFSPPSPNPILSAYYNPWTFHCDTSQKTFVTSISVSNMLEVNFGRYTDINLYLDMELYRLNIFYNAPLPFLAPSTSLSIQTAIITASGGVLDNGIDAFHSLLGIDSDGRKNVSGNEFVFYFYDYNSERFLIHVESARETTTITDPILTFNYAPSANITLHASTKIPLSLKSPFNISCFDYSLGISYIHPIADLGIVVIQGDYISLGYNTRYEPYLVNDVFRCSLTIQDFLYRGFFLNITGETPRFIATNTTDLDCAPITLSIGSFLPLNNSVSMFFYFSEDVSSFGPAVDFSFGAGASFLIE